RPGVGIVRPSKTQCLLLRVLSDHVGVQPVEHLHEAHGAHQLVEALDRQPSGFERQDRQQAGFEDPCLPQLQAKVVVRTDLFGDLPDLSQSHAELRQVAGAAFDVLLANSLVAQHLELGEHLLDHRVSHHAFLLGSAPGSLSVTSPGGSGMRLSAVSMKPSAATSTYSPYMTGAPSGLDVCRALRNQAA